MRSTPATTAITLRCTPRVGDVWYAVVVCQSVRGRDWERHVAGRVIREFGAHQNARVRQVPRVPRRIDRSATTVGFYLW